MTLPGVQDPENNNTWTAPIYSYIYDDYGNQAGVVDPKGRVTVSLYDHLNRLVRTYQPFAYTGDLTAAAIYAAAVAANVPYESTSYDEHDRVLTQTDYEGHYTVFAYDAFGRVEYERHYVNAAAYNAGLPSCNANPQIYTTYDTLGRKRFVTVQSFDGSGQAVDTARQWGYSYDDEGRTKQITSPQGMITYGYSDITGRKTLTCKDLTDFVTRYGYDELGRLDAVQVMMRGGVDVSSEGLTRYGYDLVGNLDWVQLPNGNYTQYSYDSQNRLREQTNYVNNQPSAAVLSQYVYTMLADGQRKTSTENVWNPATSSYDTTVLVWEYDALSRFLSESRNGITTEQYVYDLVGNRLQKTTGSGTTYYFYNAQNQLEKESLQSDGSTPTIQYEYDANGSLTKKYLGPDKLTAPLDILAYDLQGRLAVYQPHTGQAAAYTYNPDGIRTGKTVGTMAAAYLVDPMNPTGYEQVLQSDDGEDEVYYVLGLDVIGQVQGSGDRAYYLYDGHGSVRQQSDSSGDVGSDYDYDAYGNALNFVPDDGLYYTGEMYDATAGQYYLRARYYEPENGRFNTVDSWEGNQEEPISLHKYLYCHADPINNIDPTGLFTQKFGYLAEDAIQQIYAIDHPLDEGHISYGSWTRLGSTSGRAFKMKPDIMNHNQKTWLEIKPLSVSGVAKAGIQYKVYDAFFNIFRYKPDASWTPSNHFTTAGQFEIFFFNAGGIVFYTDMTDNLEDLAALSSLEAVKSFMCTPAGRKLMTQTITGITSRIPALVKARNTIDRERLKTHLQVASLMMLIGGI